MTLIVTNLDQHLDQQVQAECLVSLHGAPEHPPASPTVVQLWGVAGKAHEPLVPYGKAVPIQQVERRSSGMLRTAKGI